MQLPVDIGALLEEAVNVEAARATPLSVSVYVDETAPGDVAAHVRQAFASASDTARVSLIYLDGREFAPSSGDDMACIVAGLDENVGAYARACRKAGVPAMVVTTLPQLVGAIAKAAGCAIPEADIVAPKLTAKVYEHVSTAAGQGPAITASWGAPKPPENGDVGIYEPIELIDDARATLDARMGQWVCAACRAKRLAFAQAFPFVRRPLALETVNATAVQNAGVGLLFLIPGADLPVMTLNQAKMLLQIAAAYGQSIDAGRVRELAALVGGAFACRAVARRLAAAVPVLGWAVRAAVGYSGTFAMGHAAVEFYEGGPTVAKFAEYVSAARDKAIAAAAKQAAGAAADNGAAAVEAVRVGGAALPVQGVFILRAATPPDAVKAPDEAHHYELAGWGGDYSSITADAEFTARYTAIPHTEAVDKAVEPTCTKTGLTEGMHCSVCNAVLVEQNAVPAKGHTEVVDKAVEPTCTETGLTEGKHCSVCNKVLVKQDLVRGMVSDESELITIFYGADTPEADAKALLEKFGEMFPDCDVEVHDGGQPLYYYMFSVE